MNQEPDGNDELPELPPAGVFLVCARCGRPHRQMRLTPDVQRAFVKAIAQWLGNSMLKDYEIKPMDDE